jgi:hypothetical protein
VSLTAKVQLGVLAGLMGLLLLVLGVAEAFDPLFGTPVTATIERDCGWRIGPAGAYFLACRARWSAAGQAHRGTVAGKRYGYKGEQVQGFVRAGDTLAVENGLPEATRLLLVGVAVATLAVLARLRMLGWRYARWGQRLGPGIYLRGLAATTGAVLVAVGLTMAGVGVARGHGLATAWGAGVAAAGVVPLAQAGPLGRRLRSARAAAAAELERERVVERRARAERAAQAEAAAVRGSHRTVPLSEVVVDAIRMAATERPDQPLTTGRVLAALMRMDVRADWQRIWLYTGDPATTQLADVPDPPDGPPADWHDIPISGRLARALALLDRLCADYLLGPAGSGATMLALVAERGNGATGALLRRQGLTHARLLRLVQNDILELDLLGLSALIPAATE